LKAENPAYPARVYVKRVKGYIEEICSQTIDLKPGDEVVVETPGGGGYGALK
jgi:N-methylhydantoinase B